MNTLTNYPSSGRRCFALPIAATPALLLLLSFSSFGAELRGVVSRVIDGDTIVVQAGARKYKICLSGIDAPESKQLFGKESRAELVRQIEGKAVVIVWAKKDRYARLLGTILLGSVNVNALQLQAGYAWYYKRYAIDVPEIERLQYEAAECEAREAKRGLWRQRQAMPPWEFRRGRRPTFRTFRVSSPRSLQRFQ